MSISLSVVRSLVAEVERKGLDRDTLLAQAGFDRRMLSTIAGEVHGADFQAVVCAAMELTGELDLGLSIGMRTPQTTLHVLGALLLTCKTLREAAQVFQLYSGLVVRELAFYLETSGDQAAFGYRCKKQDPAARFAAECALTLSSQIARHFMEDERALEVHFVHAEPAHTGRYREVFGCPVLFEQPANQIVVRRAVLDRVQVHADARFFGAMRDTVDKLHRDARGADSFADRIRIALRYERDFGNVNLDVLAKRCGVTRRTLRRRLGVEGQSISELIDEARCQRAVEALAQPEREISKIAGELGFLEPSSFHRAFKRWTGQPPGRYRRQLLKQAAEERRESHSVA